MTIQKLFYSIITFNRFHLKNTSRSYSIAKRLNKIDPTNHSLNDISKFYTIPDVDFTTCYDGLIKNDFSRLLNAFNDKSIIIRAPAIETINYIKSSDLSKPIARYVFYGQLGSGKTVQMAHVLHYVYLRKDWLLLTFPNIFNFLHMSPELTVNSRDESLFDTPTLSVLWLNSFLNMNREFLKRYNPKTLNQIDWNQKENLEKGSYWTDMINFAISRPKYSSDCIGILLREARMHAMLNEFKVLAVIRGVNCLFQKSHRADITQNYIAAERIAPLNHLRRLIRDDWHNGAVVCSVNVDTIYERPLLLQSHYPKHLLGSTGFHEMDPFVPIEVPSYTESEVSNYLDFLAENQWLSIPEAKDPHGIGRKEIAFLADRRPQELFNVTREW